MRLVDQAGMTLFRVIYETADWERANDNADANTFDWTYYNSIYSSAEFTKLWEMMAYLNQRGITNGAFFNFMGWGPSWMMQSDATSGSLKPGMEAEWAEMITSLLVYARNTRGLQFNLVAPDNEPDLIAYPEGIHIPTATQYASALHKLALRLDSAGMGDVGLVGPDLSIGGTTYLPQMMADPVIMAKLRHFGMHGYTSGGGSSGVRSYLLGSAYPDRTFWMTEFNVWCDSCENGTSGTGSWSYARGTAEYLLAHLLNGASGSQVWEAYDSKYAHGPAYNGVSGTNKWSYWGLLGVDNPNAAVKTYTPRKQFYTHAQISKWVRPGAQRINVTGSASPFSSLAGVQACGFGPSHHCGHQHVGQRGHPERHAGITAGGSAPGPLLHVGHRQPGRWRQRGGQQRDVQRDDSGGLRVHVDRVHRGQCRPHQSGQRRAIHRAGDDPAGRYGHDHGGQYCAGLVLQRGDPAWRSHRRAVWVYVEQRADGQLCADRCRR